MLSTGLPAADSSFGFDPSQLEELCTADLDRLREALRALRDQRASGAFLELEKAAGIRQGELSRFLDGHRDLHCGQVLELIRLLREDPAAFYGRVYPRRFDQSSPSGLLVSLAEEEKHQERPEWLDRLLAWSDGVEISSAGQSFAYDSAELLGLRQRDFDAAERAGIAALEYFLSFADGTLADSAAVPFAKWISTLAILLRNRGRRVAAGWLFALAFEIEAKVEDPGCRSYIARNACYLLSDWGHHAEASDLAIQAVDSAVRAADWTGIGLGQYALAVMSTYKGNSKPALEAFESCLHYFDDSHIEWRILTLQSMAVIFLENHESSQAGFLMNQIDELPAEPISKPTRARVALTRAELASQVGDLDQASMFLDRAARLFDELGEPAELAMVYLYEVRHFLRHGRAKHALERASSLCGLASDGSLAKFVQAMLLQIARLSQSGELTLELAASAIGRWRKALPRVVVRPDKRC